MINKEKFSKVLNFNLMCPIIIQDEDIEELENVFVFDVFKGKIFENVEFVNKLESVAKSLQEQDDDKKVALVFLNLNKLTLNEQEVFYMFFKDKKINNFCLPKNMQIIIVVKEKDIDKISTKIKSICFTLR